MYTRCGKIITTSRKYMVNPVGSYKTKYWIKSWIPIKEKISIDQTQYSVIVGSLLGDGTMRIGERAVNANFKTEQGIEQKNYVFWKYEFLKPLVFTEPKLSYRYRNTGEKYEKSWWFRTIRHPLLTNLYNMFYTGDGYRTGRKIIPINISKFLNPLAVSIWIMDDGSYSRGKIDISTYSFTLQEIKRLQKSLLETFKINSNFYKDRNKGYRMYFNMHETKKIVKLIKPYVIKSMMYKIGL